MKQLKEWSGVVALVAIILTWVIPSPALFGASGTRFPNGLSTDSTSPSAGQLRTTTFLSTGAATLQSTLTLGTNATALSKIKAGDCIIFAYATTIAASSTGTVDCQGGASALTAISGITAGDSVWVQATTSWPTTFGGLLISGAKSSSTDGYIEMDIVNNTGGTFTWTNTASTSIKYFLFDY